MHLNAGAGRPPKEDRSSVRNRNPSVKVWQEIENTPFENGRRRELPPLPTGQGLWHGRTLKWWDNVRTMPHARFWGESDWDFAIDTACLHHRYWFHADSKMAAELRIRERLMGITYEARIAMGIRYKDPDPEPALAEVKEISAAKPRKRVKAIDPDGA